MTLKQSNESWQRLLQSGADAVAAETDRRCEHCGAVQQWNVIASVSAADRLFGYPLPCECGGAKKAAQDRAAREENQRDIAKEAARKIALQRAGLVGRLAECTLDSFKRRKDWAGALECAIRARVYWQAIYSGRFGSKPWLVLYGDFGTGKTHLAAAIIREAVMAGWGNVCFRSWTEHLSSLQASWDRERGEARAADIINELKKGKLAAIDDIDKRESRGWAQGELYAVLNYRYNACLPTILTFNCAPTQPDPQAKGRAVLERYMGRMLIDRIIESAFSMINFDGPSYRSGIKW